MRVYSVPIPEEDRGRVRELLRWYTSLLQRAIDRMWGNMSWEFRAPKLVREENGELRARVGKLHVPYFPWNKDFMRTLRQELVELNRGYSKRWVDSMIREAGRILKIWRKRYLRGRAKKIKPLVRKPYARARWGRMSVNYSDHTIRVTLRPGEHLWISWKGAWFSKRVEGWKVGEVILQEDRVLIPFIRAD
ncbi:MAG TPA: hypothetical protein ENF57_01870 [Candidatus Korarchaeota archaeon]|nr:hypothetical protein [Candidatus Korarchaeota archaeon]